MALTDTLLGTDYSKYACNVFINGQPLATEFEIISVQIKQAYQHITSAQISFKQPVGLGSSPIPNLFSSNLPIAGSPIAIKAKLDFDEIILFEGNIVNINIKIRVAARGFKLPQKTKL
jgi:hypothetical protein